MTNYALSTESLTWLIDCSLKISVLAIGVLVVAQILQRRSAVLAHHICVTALLVAPVISITFVLPAWQLPSEFGIKSHDEFRRVESPTTKSIPDTRPPPTANRSTMPVTQDSIPTTKTAAVTQPVIHKPLDAEQVIRGPSQSLVTHIPIVSILAAVWFLVATSLSLRTIMAFVELHRFLNRCAPAGLALQESVERTASQLKIRQHFQVRLARANTMPFVSWLGGWSVVLPASFESWSSEEQTAVLTHELGHVARRDCLASLVVRGICCIAWPHVFLQLLRVLIGRLREPACDEWAVAHGTQDATNYGTALLNAVSRCQPVTTPLVTSMAGPGGLESRILRLSTWRLHRSVPSLAIRQLTSAMVVLLTVAIATGQAQTPEPGTPQPTSEASRSASQSDVATISVRGSVVTADGSPVADALVFLQPSRMSFRWSPVFIGVNTFIGRTTTQQEGTFEFDRTRIPRHLPGVKTAFERGESGAALFVWTEKKGFAHADLQALTAAEPLDLRLRPGVIVSGMVVDENGQPIAGATVSLGSAFPIDERPEISALAGNRLGQQIPLSVTTNSAGLFEFGGLPEYFHVGFTISAPGFTANQRFGIETTISQVGVRRPDMVQKPFEIKRLPIIPLRKERLLHVRVVDHQGTQVKAGRIHFPQNLSRLESPPLTNNGTTALDLNKCRNEDPIVAVYTCDPDTPHPGQRIELDASAWEQTSQEPLVLRLPKPRWLTGRLLDAATNDAVGQRIILYNAHDIPMPWSSCASRNDGTFQLPVAIGKGLLRIQWPAPFTNDARMFQPHPIAIDVRDSGELNPLDIYVSRGRAIHGIVEDVNGSPAQDVVVHCKDLSVTTDSAGHYKFSGISPFADAIVTCWSDHGGATHLIPAADTNDWPRGYDTPLDLRLDPGVILEGRVLRDGRPLPSVGLDVHVSIPGDTQPFQFAYTVQTNSDGKYQIRGLLPGQGFRLKVRGHQIWHWKYDAPHWPTIDADETRKTVTLPDAWTGDNNQQLAGTVKDTSGTPLADITVQTCWLDGGRLTHQDCRKSPTTQTDAKGRFSFRGLPNAPLLLRAIGDPAADGSKLPKSEIMPARNATGVEITLDHAVVE